MKRAWTRLARYVREDLREIAAPSSLPDPPGAALKRRLTLKQWREVRLFYFDQMHHALISSSLLEHLLWWISSTATLKAGLPRWMARLRGILPAKA